LHFGLGGARTMTDVRVRWPDGTTQMFHDLPADRFYRLRESGVPIEDDRINRPRPTK
jgi:hypothetical protein